MTERLPNNGETAWGDILGANDGTGGFLRVAHNDDGTQILPGGSFLIADLGIQLGLTSFDSVNATWTLNTSAGADLAIDGGDSTKVNIATDGLYQVIFNCQAGQTAAGPITEVLYGMKLNGSPVTNDVTWLGTDSSAGLISLTNIWVFPFSAGDFLQFYASVGSSADTWKIAGGSQNLMIYRFA